MQSPEALASIKKQACYEQQQTLLKGGAMWQGEDMSVGLSSLL